MTKFQFKGPFVRCSVSKRQLQIIPHIKPSCHHRLSLSQSLVVFLSDSTVLQSVRELDYPTLPRIPTGSNLSPLVQKNVGSVTTQELTFYVETYPSPYQNPVHRENPTPTTGLPLSRPSTVSGFASSRPSHSQVRVCPVDHYVVTWQCTRIYYNKRK